MIKTIVKGLGGAHAFVNNKEYNINDRFAVITVTQSTVCFNETDNMVDHLIIPAWDIDSSFTNNKFWELYPDAVMFDDAFAKEIRIFVELNIDKVDYFLIHCDAGVSRSRAVAGALEWVYNGNDKEHFKKGVPNPTIYKLLLKTYGFSNDYSEHDMKEPTVCYVCGRNWSLESGLWNSDLGKGRSWHVECDADYQELLKKEQYLTDKIDIL